MKTWVKYNIVNLYAVAIIVAIGFAMVLAYRLIESVPPVVTLPMAGVLALGQMCSWYPSISDKVQQW